MVKLNLFNKIMKKIIFLILLVLNFTACKKKSESPSTNNSSSSNQKSFVKFKVDGVAYEFNLGLTNLYTDTKQGGFTFNNGNSSNLLSFTSSLDNMELVPKTYTFSNNGFNNMTLVLDRNNANTGTYKVYNSTGPLGECSFSVTKLKSTGANSSAINGTFTAKMYNKNGDFITITEGEFYNPQTN